MDLDLLAACEGLAANVYDEDDSDLAADVVRWKNLFGLTAAEAEREIREWRSSIGRKSEYALATQRLPTTPRSPRGDARMNPKSRFLLKLEGLLPDVKAAQEIGNLDSAPTKYQGADDGGEDVEFCIINATAKQVIEKRLRDQGTDFRPTFIRISDAEKDLSPICRHPTLGIDSTMPQHRLQNETAATPTQNEYPVWYFFYGTLADKDVLARVLQRDEISTADLLPAQVRGGRLTTWAGKYRAMIHADLKAPPVTGSAYLVKSREEEDALRFYETERYAVVRCRIQIAGESGRSEGMDGLTFLFLG